MPPSLSFRGAKRRGNLLQPVTFSPRPTCYPIWYCEIATAPLGPRNDNLGVLAILATAGTSRSCSAGRGMPRPYKGSCHFNDALYESAVYRRARLSPPLQHPAACRIFSIVPYSPGKIHPVGKKRSLSVKSMEKRLKTGPFCDTINLYQNECTARRRGLHLHTDTTILGGKHHECSRDHGTAQRIFL